MDRITIFLVGGIIFLIIIVIVITYLVRKLILRFKKAQKIERPTSYLCLDGHKVKSKGELIIDDLLFNLGIPHKYEETIQINGNSVKYDWYLPSCEVYIEYWGYYGKDYLKRKEEKKKLYRKAKLNLISVEDIMLENIHYNFKKELEKFIDLNSNKKYCPNCGENLDNRF
ncbi:MAG: helicase IV [Candidatus Lokiarchaeota archaeon]|nr:helicase IV [Candidatus Lokiarchaeota archaeon]MBD3341797.1 helicase IV [Candidatus Lokiarchaeota archaeon]